MAIKLNVVKPTTQTENALRNGYLYKDIEFDLKPSYTENNELFKLDEKSDLKPIYDTRSVLTALKNILTTSPGEKLLNPTFGLDLRDYLFEPVTEVRGYFLGEDILFGLPSQDSRIQLNEVRVLVNPEEQEYQINLNLSIPSLNVYDLSLNGLLNNDGYTFV
jgi:phage baseplate assembly protein W